MHLAEYYEFKALKAGMEIGYKIDKELKLTTTTGDSYYNCDSDEKGWEVETKDCVLCLGDVYIPKGLYVTGHTCDFKFFYRMNKVQMTEWDKINVLNTLLMQEKTYRRDKIEHLIQNTPDMSIVGLKHNGNTVTEIYGFPRISAMLYEENVAVHYEQVTDRGNYLKFKVYTRYGEIKPLNGCCTGHLNGRWDWDVAIDHIEEDSDTITVYLRTEISDKNHTYELQDIVIAVNNKTKTYKIISQPDDKTLASY